MRERDAYFRHPSLFVYYNLGIPNRVPRRVFPCVVVDDGIDQRAGRGDREVSARKMVMARSKINGDPVGIDIRVIAALQTPSDLLGFAIVHTGADVESLVIVKNADFRFFSFRFAFVRVVLFEASGRLR